MRSTDLAYKLREITISKREEVINNFDFENVHSLMVVRKWTWVTCGGNVPTVAQLKDAVEQMFQALINNEKPDTRIGIGGFKLYRHVWEDSVEIELVFGYENASAYSPLDK